MRASESARERPKKKRKKAGSRAEAKAMTSASLTGNKKSGDVLAQSERERGSVVVLVSLVSCRCCIGPGPISELFIYS